MQSKGRKKPGWDGKPGCYVLDRIYLVRVTEPHTAELLVEGFWQPFAAPYSERLGTPDAVMVPEEEFADLVAMAVATAKRKQLAQRDTGRQTFSNQGFNFGR